MGGGFTYISNTDKINFFTIAWIWEKNPIIEILPSSVRMSNGHVSATAVPPRNPTWVWWRRTSAGTVVIISTGRWHRSPSSPTRGHTLKAAVSAAGPVATGREPTHRSAPTYPLLKHHSEATVFVCLIIEVRVIGLCAALYGSLQGWKEFLD